jgi:hypothetical protein
MTPYEQGQHDILASLGIVKEASPAAGAGLVARWLPKLRTFGGNVARNFKNIMIGSPFKAIDEIQAGKALAKGGLIRGGFHPGKGLPGVAFGGLMYGLPAYEAYQVMQSDNPNKAEALGRLVGGTAAGLGTWKAFGMLGSMAAAPIGSALGGAIGKGVSTVAGGNQSPQQQQQPAKQYPQRPYYTPYGIATAGAGRHMMDSAGWGPR